MLRLVLTVLVLCALGHAAVEQLSQADKDAFLMAHNDARQAVGVSALTWDNAAAQNAANWAGQCQWAHQTGNSYGENLYASWPQNSDSAALAAIAVNSWNSEKSVYDAEGTWDCAFRSQNTCGHYSQVVWANTQKVGCAIAHCPSWMQNYVVCEYAPPGNYIGQEPY